MSTTRRIDPTALYPHGQLVESLGCSRDTVAELEQLFGLFPVFSGGRTPRVFLGKTVIAALERRGRGQVCPVRSRPLKRDAARRLMAGKAASR